MNVEISGIRVTMTEEIDEFIRKKIKKVERYLRNITSSHVILKSEKGGFETEINIHTKGSTINAREIADELYASIEGAIKKIVVQCKKYKEKTTERKKKAHRASEHLIREDEEREKQKAVVVQRESAKPMEIEEALTQLNLSDHNFLIFLNARTGQINAIYKKDDGSIVLVEPF